MNANGLNVNMTTTQRYKLQQLDKKMDKGIYIYIVIDANGTHNRYYKREICTTESNARIKTSHIFETFHFYLTNQGSRHD